jgi:magnesium-transporting ATPase (P-type)
VNQIFELGLRVIMVTGDYSLTSVSMAAQAGIFSSKKYDTLNKFRQNKTNNIPIEFSYTRGILLNGAEVENLSEDEFELIYSEYYQMIVCRATPNHKIQLIKLLQANKKSVLMVGDGLNDVSALKQADQSVAMNSGSKLAADVSNIILLNNSFNSIYDLLLIGRKNILNNQKAFMFCLTSVFTQYASTLPSSLFGIPQLYSNVQMILLNTFLDFLPTMTLLFEKSDSASIKSAGNMRIFNFKIVVFSLILGLITTFFAYLAFFFYLFKFGGIELSSLFFNYFSDAYLNHHFIVAQSVAFYTIVIIHMFGNLYSIRTMYKSIFETVPLFGTYSNIYLVTSSVLVAVFMILVVTFPIPGLTANLIPLFYVLPFIGSIIIVVVIELFRFVFLRKKIFPFND